MATRRAFLLADFLADFIVVPFSVI